MTKSIFSFCLMVMPLLLFAQVGFINNGVNIKVKSGTDLKVNGSITNKNSGAITNDGNIHLDLDYTQNTSASYTGGAMSWLWFEGSASQNITSDTPMNIARLKVDNGNLLVFGNHVNVSTDADLNNNGSIQLGNYNLVMASSAPISNYNASNYVITNGTGVLQQQVGATNMFFPVGNSTYNPTTLNNSGTMDDFLVRVVDQVLDQGTTGAPVANDVVNRTWMIDEASAGGSNVTMTLQWDAAEEQALFDRTLCGIYHHVSGTNWDIPAYTAAANVGGSVWSQTGSGFTSFSPFAVGDEQSPLPVELISFNAERRNAKEVLLEWSTASEINNSGFWVERMLEGETAFRNVGWVDGAGNSTSVNNYDYVDDNDFEGISYYRLQQVDFDGRAEYTETKTVLGIKTSNPSLAIYPNPTSDAVHILFFALETTEETKVQILDARGRLIYNQEHTVSNQGVLTLNAFGMLPSGIYMLSVQLGNNRPIMNKVLKK